MRSREKSVVDEAFLSVRAYLVYPQELRRTIEEISLKSKDIDAFVTEFKRAVSAQEDPSRRTDGQIFLNELRRRL